MNRTARSLLFCAALTAAAAAPARAAAEARPASEAAALDKAFAAIKTDPVDRARLLLAAELLPDGRSPRAAALEDASRRLLKASGEDYAGYLGLCKALRCSGRLQDAVANCRKALELEPTAYPVYRELGLAYAAAGDARKATETLEQGVELSSSDYKARYTLAKVLEARGDSARAAASYARAVELSRRDGSLEARYYAALARSGARRCARARPKAKAAPKPRAKAAPKTSPAGAAEQADCLKKFKEEFLKDNLGSALEQSDICARLSPSDPQLASERAPLLVRLGRYEDGVKEYERAAALYRDNKPMEAFCRGKAAETWLKLGDPAKAVEQYRKALAANPGDLNALKGLAAALEARSDTKGAEETYEAILKLSPGDAGAKARLEELRTAALTDEQVLEELRSRQAADPAKTALTPEDRKLFEDIKDAELAGAADYLKRKAPAARGLTAERKTPEGVRLLLTSAGYRAYVAFASRDAVKLFEGKGIGLRELFKLRDLSGAQIFDPAGKLTAEGLKAWRDAEEGRKSWLLPAEPVPQSAQARRSDEAAAKIAEWNAGGYAEISEPEYLWLLKATTCPDATLKRPPVEAVKEIFDGVRTRYLLCSDPAKLCTNKCNSRLPEYVAAYRSNNTALFEGGASGAFFGIAGAKRRRFCENGEVWVGGTGSESNPCSTASAPR